MGTSLINNDAFQEVEYLESTATQYIDTGINGNNDNLSFGIKYLSTILPTGYRYILGSYISEDNNCTRILQYGNNITYYNINTKAGGGTTQYDGSRLANVIYEEVVTPNLLTINSNNKTISNHTKGDDNNVNICIWKEKPTGSSSSNNLRIYYLKIYDNNILVRDFAPCYRKSDNELGLYDIVNNEFYTNQGTGTFLKGDNVNSGAIEHIIINDT